MNPRNKLKQQQDALDRTAQSQEASARSEADGRERLRLAQLKAEAEERWRLQVLQAAMEEEKRLTEIKLKQQADLETRLKAIDDKGKNDARVMQELRLKCDHLVDLLKNPVKGPDGPRNRVMPTGDEDLGLSRRIFGRKPNATELNSVKWVRGTDRPKRQQSHLHSSIHYDSGGSGKNTVFPYNKAASGRAPRHLMVEQQLLKARDKTVGKTIQAVPDLSAYE